MEKLYIDKWFKLPPIEKLNEMRIIVIKKRKAGRKSGKSNKKIKK